MSTDELMTEAGNLLNRGETWRALMAYYDIRDMQRGKAGKATAEVMQMIGLCLRMLTYYSRADEAFEEALDLATTDEQKGKIYRDWAMVPLMLGDVERARELVVQSLVMLREFPLEAAISEGFMGRVFMKRGEFFDAADCFKMADRKLRGARVDTHTAELNNLVWWLKVELNPYIRLRLVLRGLCYAWRDRHMKRIVQLIGLLAAGPYARYFRTAR